MLLKYFLFILILCGGCSAFFMPNIKTTEIIGAQCLLDLIKFQNGIKTRELWALNMFDASSKLPPGMLNGNLVGLGSYEQCINIKELTENHVMLGKYCMAKVALKSIHIEEYTKKYVNNNFNNTNRDLVIGAPGLTLALCAPDSCSAEEIKKSFQYAINKFQIPIDISEIDPKSCLTIESGYDWTTGDWIVIGFLAVILGLIIICTTYDIYIQKLKREPAHMIFLAFSLYTNGKKLISTNDNPNQLHCLDGIRFISMMWVVLGHKFTTFTVTPMLNLTDLYQWVTKISSMYIIGATVSVDSFFVLSGLLVTYVTFKSLDKGVKFNLPLYYLHRYLRLTPILAIIIAIHVTILKHMGSGPYWSTLLNLLKDTCDEYWWTDLLYVQNYVNPVQICLGQTWYLSVDMQLFILSPILLIPLWKWRRITLYAIILLILASMGIPFFVSWVYEFNGWTMAISTADYQKQYYVPIQTRFGPYVMGMVLGFYIYKVKKNKNESFKLNNIVVWIGWILSILILITVVYAPFNMQWHEYNKLESSFFLAMHRHAWSFALCWVIFACIEGYGGPVNWCLSLPLFQVLGRLTYSMYLIHATVMVLKLGQIRTTEYFSELNLVHAFCGEFMITVMLSIVSTLAFESPMITIEKVLFKAGDQKQKPIAK